MDQRATPPRWLRGVAALIPLGASALVAYRLGVAASRATQRWGWSAGAAAPNVDLTSLDAAAHVGALFAWIGLYALCMAAGFAVLRYGAEGRTLERREAMLYYGALVAGLATMLWPQLNAG